MKMNNFISEKILDTRITAVLYEYINGLYYTTYVAMSIYLKFQEN